MKRNASIYSLTPRETVALEEWLKDNLAKGYIQPSKSPWACSFFFVQKKDGKLRPVQDYVPLNEITIVNAAPLPLIGDLLDKLRGARYFTKFDLRSGYNNICIKAGNEWKAAFKTSFGLFEPLVMTFGLCNAPATFQTFMNTLFQDLIDQGHVVVYLDDILLFQDSQTKLTTLTHEVLRRLQDNHLFLSQKSAPLPRPLLNTSALLSLKALLVWTPPKLGSPTIPYSLQSQRSPSLPRFLQLLSSLHQRLFHHRATFVQPHHERHPLHLGAIPAVGF
jgi:hypothetical protein